MDGQKDGPTTPNLYPCLQQGIKKIWMEICFASHSYGVNISQLICFERVCSVIHMIILLYFKISAKGLF